MNNQSKSNQELIKELQELQHAHNSLKASYKKDIAEHKQAVEALSLFRELIDKSNDTFEVLDSETGEFLDVNARGCIDLGYSREELLSMSIFDIDPTLNLTLFQKAVDELHKSGALTWEGSHRRKDGSMFPVEVNIKSVQLDIDYIVTVVRDITTRKQAEAELLESQEKYTDLYETAPVGIYRTKIDGSKILEINNTLCEMLGFTKEEFLSQPSPIRWADPNRRNEIVEILKENGVATNFDADILKKDGSRISCLLSMNIFKDEGYIEGFIVDISDRMRAEDEVRQSRKELDTLFEASPELISFIGFDGYFKRLNPAWVNTLGYPMDKLLSLPFIEFVHPDDREASNAEVAKLAGGQRTIRFDNRYRCNDGSYRWLSWSVIPDLKEKLLYAVARDITERKISEDKLHFQSEIMNNMTEAVYLIRMKDDVIVYTNSQFEEMFGYSQNEMLGKNVSIVNAPTEKDPETTVREIMSVLAEKGVWEGEVKNIRKDRTTFSSYAKVSVFEHSQFGRVLISVHRDITDRKRAEETLDQERFLLRTIIDNFPNSIFVKDKKYRKIVVNLEHARRVTAHLSTATPFSKEYLLGKTDFEVYPRELAEEFIIEDQKVIDGGQSVLNQELLSIDTNGRTHWELISKIPLWDRNGEIIGLVGISNDITGRKLVEQALIQSEENFHRSISESFLGIRIISIEGETIYVNKAFLDIYGYNSLEKFRSIPTINRYTPESYVQHQIRKEKIKNGHDIFDYEVSIVRENAEVRYVKVWKKEVLWNGVKHYQAFNLDITEQKQSEEALNNSQQELRKFATHLQNVREEEKLSLAREIHDDLGQILVALKMDLGMFKKKISRGNENINSEEILSKFDDFSNLVDNTIKSARRIMNGLRPELIELLGFEEACKSYLRDFDETHHIKSRFESAIMNLNISLEQSVALFRIFQEALTNVAKHAKATLVTVQLSNPAGKLRMVIIDNGVGFDENNKGRQDSYGMIGIKERVFLLEGELNITSKVGKGTSVRVEIPY